MYSRSKQPAFHKLSTVVLQTDSRNTTVLGLGTQTGYQITALSTYREFPINGSTKDRCYSLIRLIFKIH